MSQLDPIVNQPFLYANGLLLSNDATTPNTKLDVAAGVCRDSNNQIDINLGNYLGLSGIGTANAATVINFAVNGVNGLDTGTFAASTGYYIFVIADSSQRNLPGAIASLSASAPTLPFGYDSIRLIGWVLSDGSVHLLKFYASGFGGSKYFQWDAPIAVTVTASGTSATYSAMDFSVGMPSSNFGNIWFYYKWTNNAANDQLKFQPAGATGDFVAINGVVAGVAQEDQLQILPLIASAKPEVSYKTSAGTLNNIFLQAFNMAL